MSLLENYTKQDLITKIGAQTIPTIIYGAGVSGQALLFACRESGIKVVGFCDNNIKKKGKSLLDIEIIHTDDIKSRFPNANWLIASADITDIRDHLIDYGYDETNLYPGATLLRDYNLENFSKHYESYNEEDNDKGFIEFAVASTIQCHDGYLDSSKVFMRSVDIVVTEKCTMKCVDCSNLMQYFEKPESYEIQEMNEAIEALCSVSDEIFEFRVIGGEPFVNKEVHLVVEKLIAEPKVKRIVI